MPETFGFGGFQFDPDGFPVITLDSFEDRQIVLAAGIEAHDEDVPEKFRPFTYLKDRLGDDFIVNSDTDAEYSNPVQKVHYTIKIIKTKKEFQAALENPDVHVIYDGHSRYGRGSCFHTYTGKAPQTGEQWEKGTGDDNGIFRLGYPFVPVETDDFEHHQYTFRPVPGEEDAPAREDRHPDAQRGLSRLKMPEEHRARIDSGHESPDNLYWGYKSGGKTNFLLVADWVGSQAFPFDIGNTNLQCKVFCHFGCSSKLHYREIIRGKDFMNWVRPTPPTEKFAYFTTAPSNAACTPIWLHALLTYAKKNNFESWFDSLEEAKKKANKNLKKIKQRYEVF